MPSIESLPGIIAALFLLVIGCTIFLRVTKDGRG